MRVFVGDLLAAAVRLGDCTGGCVPPGVDAGVPSGVPGLEGDNEGVTDGDGDPVRVALCVPVGEPVIV